eukprot:scpid109510/ scgid5908/ 
MNMSVWVCKRQKKKEKRRVVLGILQCSTCINVVHTSLKEHSENFRTEHFRSLLGDVCCIDARGMDVCGMDMCCIDVCGMDMCCIGVCCVDVCCIDVCGMDMCVAWICVVWMCVIL